MAKKFQVMSVKPLSGRSESGRNWAMMIYSGVLTNDDDTVEVGELSMMLSDGQPAPDVKPGGSYLPVVSFSARKGKLEPRLVELRPLAAVAAPVRAAASGS